MFLGLPYSLGMVALDIPCQSTRALLGSATSSKRNICRRDWWWCDLAQARPTKVVIVGATQGLAKSSRHDSKIFWKRKKPINDNSPNEGQVVIRRLGRGQDCRYTEEGALGGNSWAKSPVQDLACFRYPGLGFWLLGAGSGANIHCHSPFWCSARKLGCRNTGSIWLDSAWL